MRLIDVDALGVGRCSKDILPAAYCAGWNGMIGILEKADTVDAVVVTRCKDCKYGDPTWAGYVCNCNEYAALESTLYHDENFFCAYGEPKWGCV